ncbi:MAG: hypothetical protein IJC90_03780 [Clostridia bacterium]|nr:hypothetical protein [Clostridia bacterium]
MKKIVSLLLVLVMALGSLSLSCFAVEEEKDVFDINNYTDRELDLTNYTLDDLSEMTPEEYTQLIRDFERVYDPFDSYEETVTETTTNPNARWTTGTINSAGEYTEEGCHEYITSIACLVLLNDKGFFANNATGAVVITLYISLASLLPDQDEIGLTPFAGHFYNPKTGRNYALSKTNVAPKNAQEHYTNAINEMKAGNQDVAFEELGRCLHYVQDLCVPHHAANITFLNASHTAFEEYAFEHAEEFIGDCETIHRLSYSENATKTVEKLAHNAAFTAYQYKDCVNDIDNQGSWRKYANLSLENAVDYSAVVMYQFGLDPVVEFYTDI